MMLDGMPVITSLYMTEPKDMLVWEPCGRSGWKRHVMRTVQVPRRDALMFDGKILVHPAVLPELRKLAGGSPTGAEDLRR